MPRVRIRIATYFLRLNISAARLTASIWWSWWRWKGAGVVDKVGDPRAADED